MKCKLNDKDISKVKKTPRDQLHRDKPGVFSIKVPQHWMEAPEYDRLLVEAAKEFLRTMGRVVSVKYFVAPYEMRGEELGQGHHFKEVPNPRNRFDPGGTWELFSFYRPKPGVKNAMPPNWFRFYDFPNTLLKP